jgi:hypothetical protein
MWRIKGGSPCIGLTARDAWECCSLSTLLRDAVDILDPHGDEDVPDLRPIEEQARDAAAALDGFEEPETDRLAARLRAMLGESPNH